MKLFTTALLLLVFSVSQLLSRNPLKYHRNYKYPKTKSPRANIILILTDDQDVELGSLQFMPKLAKHLQQGGATYSNGYATTAMCCPSRSSILTGLYVHNHQVYTNNDNCSSTFWSENHEQQTFATYLQQSGYRTSYFGKYLNKYSGQHVPPGWDQWYGLVRNSRFYNYSINSNGVMEQHGDKYEEDYLPDIITNKTLQLISRSAQSTSPFLAVLSYPGPHGPEDAAPQYQDMFYNVTTHHTPAYNFAPNPDKQWILRHTEKMLPIHKSFTDILMTKRLQTLQSVDSAVELIVQRLADTGQLDNTYIFYTSDHGYHLGQFGLVKGKAFPFEFDTHVPFIVRGPGIRPMSVKIQPVLNIDLAPTFLDIAGVRKPNHMDGKSIIRTFKKRRSKFREAFLIERGKMTSERYSIVSTKNGHKKSSLKKRLTKECSKPKYQAPCSPGQKWSCGRKDDGSLKIIRCKQRKGKSKLISASCICKSGDVFGWRNSKMKLESNSEKQFKKFEVSNFRTSPRSRFSRSTFKSLERIAQGEITDVDFIVEGVGDEIKGLHNPSNLTTSLECSASISSSSCQPMSVRNSSTWLASRSTIKNKIQQLRAQLNELKQIRKYLRLKRPITDKQSKIRHMESAKFGKTIPINKSRKELCLCDENKKNYVVKKRNEIRIARKIERYKRKERKRKKSGKRTNKSKQDHCKADVRMNCFSHDDSHWKTAPLWTGGPFCACTNSNNNTYWCVRNINSTKNYLYCEYVTGMITYFDINTDPFQLKNVLHTLSESELDFMHQQLAQLKNYSGTKIFRKRSRKTKRRNKHKKLRKQRQSNIKYRSV